MHMLSTVQPAQVQAVYSGPEGDLWELLMGEQIHVGGLANSQALADRAGIGPGTTGVDLCCCLGAGMRYLVKLRGVRRMVGVDFTPHALEQARARGRAAGLEQHLDYVLADVTATGLPDAHADFVWGEDAWCYVTDKGALIAEAARLVRPGGVIAFTDWVEGPAGLSGPQAERFLGFMKFPSFEGVGGYRQRLQDAGCTVLAAEDTGRFAPAVDLYRALLAGQLAWDALGLLGFDAAALHAVEDEMAFIAGLARERRVIQALFVARRS